MSGWQHPNLPFFTYCLLCNLHYVIKKMNLVSKAAPMARHWSESMNTLTQISPVDTYAFGDCVSCFLISSARSACPAASHSQMHLLNDRIQLAAAAEASMSLHYVVADLLSVG